MLFKQALLIFVMLRLHLNNLLVQLHDFLFEPDNDNLLHSFHGPVCPNSLHLLGEPLIDSLKVKNLPGFALQVHLISVLNLVPLLETIFELL